LFKEDRQNKIIELVNQRGSVKTSELCDLFSTTRQTIHHDLELLDKEDKLKKVYGGAVRISRAEEPSIDTRRIQYQIEKNIIGRIASTFVDEKDTIFIDVSTTVHAMLPYLKDLNRLTIITNSIEAAYVLGSQPRFDIYMIGGHVRMQDLACDGNDSLEALQDIYVDKSFFGAGGISTTAGLTDYHFTDSEIRKIMIKNSSQSFVLFDASKIESITISKFADFEEIDRLISYNVWHKDFLQFLSKKDIHFIDAKNMNTN
jgi:DeoR/GlpR family transcriptional regulator of sugar metabolism